MNQFKALFPFLMGIELTGGGEGEGEEGEEEDEQFSRARPQNQRPGKQ